MTEDNGKLTTDEARALLVQEQLARVDACKVELEALLEKHRCRLDIAMTLRANSVETHLQIVPEA